ncbi:hypothetical protein GCM10009133_08390 [Cocleimonas flava]|uniref:Amidohydrolase family protein n=1 Tax=Cocleimonas flava TaxID=634765 RepID=A0A4R1F0B9_9GAMM|nr:amidohydrolase family protein [Cocleimonas flava]TCJ87203.1 amidohydrolase family protein [Cocleimonas flava]
MKLSQFLIVFFISNLLMVAAVNAAQQDTDKSQYKDSVFDMHMHYKWSQKEVTSPEQAVQSLNQHNISHAVVIGKPAKNALLLQKLAPEKVIAIYSPYRDSQDWYRWQRNEKVLVEARKALASGDYHGIGELHILGGGFARKLDSSNVLSGLLKLVVEYDVPIMIHTEFSKPNYMLAICEKHPKSKIIWAHAGAVLTPEHVDQVMNKCPNVWSGMGARDPWRYVSNQHTDETGKLLPAWKALMIKYADRFLVGSDTVWPVDQLDGWSEPDTGWEQLGRFWGFHRSWLAQLPDDVAIKIKRENALKLFRVN